LFVSAGCNQPLSQKSFKYAYNYAKKRGYETTASVFDIESLKFLLKFDVPFIKIANNSKVYSLLDSIPRNTQVLISTDDIKKVPMKKLMKDDIIMLCVSKYPATSEDYNTIANGKRIRFLSDHTVGVDLIKQHKPDIVEKHYKLEDSTGLDAGEFAITPEQIKDVFNEN